MLEKGGRVLVLGGQPEASRLVSLGRNLKMLWAGRQGAWVQVCSSGREGYVGLSEGGEAMFVQSRGYWLYPQSSLSPTH